MKAIPSSPSDKKNTLLNQWLTTIGDASSTGIKAFATSGINNCSLVNKILQATFSTRMKS
jgi:hypothetical protein